MVTSTSEEIAFRQILSNQLVRYPQLQLQDLYKLIYQAAMGSEHAIQDMAAARHYLESEVNGLGEGLEEQTLDPISPDRRIVRINLRPYIAEGGDPSMLLTAFIKTANEYKGIWAHLRRYWSYVERMAMAEVLPFAQDELERFFVKMEAEGFPVVHHSMAYRAAYHPAYRVIARDFLVNMDQNEYKI